MSVSIQFPIGVLSIDINFFACVAEQTDATRSLVNSYLLHKNPSMYLVITTPLDQSAAKQVAGRWVDAEEFLEGLAKSLVKREEEVQHVRDALASTGEIGNQPTQQHLEIYYRLSLLEDRLVHLANVANKKSSEKVESQVQSITDEFRWILSVVLHLGLRLRGMSGILLTDRIFEVVQTIKERLNNLSDLMSNRSPLQNYQLLAALTYREAIEHAKQIHESSAELVTFLTDSSSTGDAVLFMNRLLKARRPQGTSLSDGFDEEQHIKWIQLRAGDWDCMNHSQTSAILRHVFQVEKSRQAIEEEVREFRITAFIFDRDRPELSKAGPKDNAKLMFYVELWECNRLSKTQIARIMSAIMGEAHELITPDSIHKSARLRLSMYSDASLRLGESGSPSTTFNLERLIDDIRAL